MKDISREAALQLALPNVDSQLPVASRAEAPTFAAAGQDLPAASLPGSGPPVNDSHTSMLASAMVPDATENRKDAVSMVSAVPRGQAANPASGSLPPTTTPPAQAQVERDSRGESYPAWLGLHVAGNTITLSGNPATVVQISVGETKITIDATGVNIQGRDVRLSGQPLSTGPRG